MPSSLPAVFCRGGTSNAIILQRSALPADRAAWQLILAAAMGSPDAYGRQLGGMGSGVSSTSKVCVINASQRSDADVDYTFVQVDIKTGDLDFSANCGNMSSAIGPVALNEGLVAANAISLDSRRAKVRIFNTNTAKLIHSVFATTEDGKAFESQGDFAIAGVPGTGSRIALSFINPAGSKTPGALPTGHATDILRLKDGRSIRVSLVDVATPVVHVRGADVGLSSAIPPAELEAQSHIMDLLEQIRQAGAQAMELDCRLRGVPKTLILFDGNPDRDIEVRALSMQQAHRAIPVTVALNLGAAARLSGSLPAQVTANSARTANITIGHPSGSMMVSCEDKAGSIESVSVYRTARVLMKGEVMLK